MNMQRTFTKATKCSALSFLGAGALSLTALLLSSNVSAQQGQPVDQAFTLFSEALESVEGNRIKLESQGAVTYLTTETSGSTPTFQTAIGNVYDVHLKQQSQSFGTVLGQSMIGWTVEDAVGPVDFGAVDSTYWESIFTQPALRLTQLDSSSPVMQNENDALWSIFADDDGGSQDPDFSFAAEVGSLSTAESLYRFLDYSGTQPLYEDYRYALAFQTTGVESWGKGGAGIEIDCSAFEFTAEPEVDIYFIGESDHFGETSLSIDEKGWVGSTLLLAVSGDMGEGLTLLMVRPEGDSGKALYESVYDPPSFRMVGRRRSTPPPISAPASECPPMYTPPSDPEQIGGLPDPPAPDGTGLCPPDATPSEVSLKHEVKEVGDKVCGNGGPGASQAETLTWSGSFSVGWKTPWGPSIQAGGNFGRRDTTTVHITPPGEGSGCGQCCKAYKRRSKVSVVWIVERPTIGFFYPHYFKGCVDKKRTNHKLTQAVIQRCCDIECDEESQ